MEGQAGGKSGLEVYLKGLMYELWKGLEEKGSVKYARVE